MDNQNNQQKNDYTKMDEKTIATIKASAIWNAVASVITSIGGMIASYFFVRTSFGSNFGVYEGYLPGYTPQLINIGALISAVIWGAIGGAIGGWVIAKFYPVFVRWQKNLTGNRLNSFFKILFWPYLVGFAISLLLTGAISLVYSGFIFWIIAAIADLASIYIYAKMMDKAVGKYY